MAATLKQPLAGENKTLSNGTNGNGVMLARIVWAGIGMVTMVMVAAGGFFATNTFASIDRRLGRIEEQQLNMMSSIAELKAEHRPGKNGEP
jgi:hypothetical protein